MNKSSIGLLVAVALVGSGAGFWGGMKYQQGQAPVRGQGQFAGGTFDGAQGARAQRGGGSGAAFGTILSKDADSVTIQLNAPNSTSTTAVAGSKIVLYNASTEIGKTVTGSASDLTVGESITVTGSANTDGSITAATIQIRPAMQR